MDVLVTGASGLIGTALRPALVAAGHRPIALVRRPVAGADEISWDPATGRLDRASIEGAGAAIHLAGVGIGDKRWTEEQKRVLRESRVQTTGLLAHGDRGAPGAAPDPRERIGDRVLRRSRRRDPHREERSRRRLPRPSSARHGRRPPRPPSRRGRSSPTSDRESSSPRRAARWPSCCRSSGSASEGASARAASGRAGSRSTTRWPRSCTS